MLTEDEMFKLAKPAVQKAVRTALNQVLELAAQKVEDLDLYDGYDESTRDSAAEIVRAFKVKEG